MADTDRGAQHLFLREEDLRLGIELLFFAYRNFTAEPDAILEPLRMGRAHHRAIYFIGRHPGISVGELLAILRITKQSLSRVLGQLVREGYVLQKTGPTDRRQRRLELTAHGLDLERRLSEAQRILIARAWRAAGGQAVEGYRKVMLGLIDEADRERFASARPTLRPAGEPPRPR